MKHLIRTSTLLTILVAMLTLGLVAPASAAAKTGAVKGIITLDGKPLKSLRIELHHTGNDGYENKTLDVDTTNSKGAYSFRFSVTDPEYSGHTILIKDPSGRIVNTSRAFNDRPGKTVTRNARVKAGASITGTVKRGDGATTQRLRVNVFGPYALLDRYHETVEQDVYPTYVRAAADGSYAVKGLPAGDYFLQFVDEGKTYFTQCYDNLLATAAGCDGTADPDLDSTKIPVAAGRHVTVNPQVLSTKGQRISGIVTDTSGKAIKNVSITARGDDDSVAGQDDSASSGAFTVGPLVDGGYRLMIKAASPWASQWFDRKEKADATRLDVAGQDIKGLAIRLKSRARIAATVTPGKGTVKVAVAVTRSATGGRASGKVTVSWGAVKKTVTLASGKGTAKLSGLPKGKRKITVAYSGHSSTAAASKVFYATVK